MRCYRTSRPRAAYGSLKSTRLGLCPKPRQGLLAPKALKDAHLDGGHPQAPDPDGPVPQAYPS